MLEAKCTEAEWKIMEVLWESAPRPTSEITKALEPATGWTRHTVITLLKRMQDKGTVTVDDTGDVKQYAPLLSLEAARTQQTHKLLEQAFSGQAFLLVAHLVDSKEISLKELDEWIGTKRKKKKDKEKKKKKRGGNEA